MSSSAELIPSRIVESSSSGVEEGKMEDFGILGFCGGFWMEMAIGG